MSSDAEIAEFIRSTFRSVWTLELVLLMAGQDQQAWTRGDLVAALRARDLIVPRSVAELTAAGQIVNDEEERACFRPASARLRELFEATATLYARSPDKVRRLIFAAGAGGLTAFADAFRIRKD